MKKNIIILILAAFCIKATAQQKILVNRTNTNTISRADVNTVNALPVGSSRADSLLIADIVSLFNDWTFNLEREYNRIKQQLQTSINQEKNMIRNEDLANSILQKEIKQLQALRAYRHSVLDSLTRLRNTITANPFTPSRDSLARVQNRMDSLRRSFSQIERDVQVRYDSIHLNKLQQAEFQNAIKQREQQLVLLEKEKQNILVDLDKQKQKIIKEVTKTNDDRQSQFIPILTSQLNSMMDQWLEKFPPGNEGGKFNR